MAATDDDGVVSFVSLFHGFAWGSVRPGRAGLTAKFSAICLFLTKVSGWSLLQSWPGQRESPAQGGPGGGKGICVLLFDPLQALVSVGIDARAEVLTQLERAVQKPSVMVA